jgi:fatty-acyl-CoA synthase
VTAFVVVDGAPDREAVLGHTAARLAPFKRPRQVHFVTELPRNALGKVVKSELRA